MKTALIAEGGIMRGAYALGAIDALYSHFGIKSFDYVSGSSSSIGTLAYFTSGQFYPGYYIWPKEVTSKRFFSFKNLMLGRPAMDIDYLIDVVFKQRIPLSESKLKSSEMEFIVPLTNSKTGKVEYFNNRTDIDFFEILRASMAIPFAYGKAVKIDDNEYFDGAFSDPLPIDLPGIKESRKIIILTRTKEDSQQSSLEKRLSKSFNPRPGFYMTLKKREEVYNQRIMQIKELEKQGDILIRPKRKISKFNNSLRNIEECINAGYQDVVSDKRILDFVDFLVSHQSVLI